jgi:hypothetical protein
MAISNTKLWHSKKTVCTANLKKKFAANDSKRMLPSLSRKKAAPFKQKGGIDTK